MAADAIADTTTLAITVTSTVTAAFMSTFVGS